MNLNGLVSSVSSVRITDLDNSSNSDLLVVGDGQAHWLYTTSLINRASFPVAEDAELSSLLLTARRPTWWCSAPLKAPQPRWLSAAN